MTLYLFIERYSGTPPTNQYIQPTQYLLLNMYNIYSNSLGKGVAWISPVVESCETLTLLRYRSYRCFVLEIGNALIYPKSGTLYNRWFPVYNKVNLSHLEARNSETKRLSDSQYIHRFLINNWPNTLCRDLKQKYKSRYISEIRQLVCILSFCLA